jgi:hypothetical protein
VSHTRLVACHHFSSVSFRGLLYRRFLVLHLRASILKTTLPRVSLLPERISKFKERSVTCKFGLTPISGYHLTCHISTQILNITPNYFGTVSDSDRGRDTYTVCLCVVNGRICRFVCCVSLRIIGLILL